MPKIIEKWVQHMIQQFVKIDDYKPSRWLRQMITMPCWHNSWNQYQISDLQLNPTLR